MPDFRRWFLLKELDRDPERPEQASAIDSLREKISKLHGKNNEIEYELQQEKHRNEQLTAKLDGLMNQMHQLEISAAAQGFSVEVTPAVPVRVIAAKPETIAFKKSPTRK